MGKKTLVIGASTNPNRYSYMAINKLIDNQHAVVAYGLKKGEVRGVEIKNDIRLIDRDIDTVTLYIGPQNQPDYYSFIRTLKPKRVIFNPGTVNQGFMKDLEQEGIEVVEACTLVLLSTGLY